MRNQLKTVYSVLALVATLGLTSTVHGVPAFARQTGLDCNSCHASPGYPALNSFGQAFKAGGYSQASEDDLIGDGEALSIPKTLNMSVVFKVRDDIGIPSGGGTVTNTLQFPDEIAFLTGGRVGKNIGYLIEMGGAFGNFKLVFAPELGPIRLGIVPYFSDALGPAYAFETLSTANVENIRITERKSFTSAQEAVDWGTNGNPAGAGLGIYVWHPFGFIAYSPFVASIGETDTANFAHYLRLAVTPSFSGFDLGAGFTLKTGTANDSVSGGTNTYNYMAADLQAMATLGIPLTLVVTWAQNTVSATSSSALAFAVDAQLVQDMLNVVVGYRAGLTSDQDSNLGVAVKFQVVRNIRLAVDTTFNLTSGSTDVLAMVFGAF